MTPEEKSPRPEGAQCATREERWLKITNTPERMTQWGQSGNDAVVDVSGGESKVWCCKEQYCIGTWNVRSMNQGKLVMVKQGMERLNINILAISEIKWTGLGDFNSDDHYTYYCGQESLRWNGVALRKWKCQFLSSVSLFATPWSIALQAPLSMEFST